MTKEEKIIVDKVAKLVRKYFYIQNISGIDDCIPYNIARALEDGFIRCPKCINGYDYFKKMCRLCGGKGKIDFNIDNDLETFFII